ncbi:MAG: hypothetical protein ACRYGR_01730 [Janthinobacterium lividum]
MARISSKNFLYTALISFLLLTNSSSYADCPDKTVSCTVVDADGRETLLGYEMVNYKGEKVHDAKSFFTGLAGGFKCSPCLDGCGHTVTKAILDCNNKAKAAGYKAGYISQKSLEGVSLGGAVDSVLKRAEHAAKIGGDVAAAVATVKK